MDDPLNLMRVMPTQGGPMADCRCEPDWPLSRALQRTAFILFFLTTDYTDENG